MPEEIEQALCDDLNTPAAFAVLAGLADQLRQADDSQARRQRKAALLGAGLLLGLLQDNPEQWFQQTSAGSEIDPAWVDELLAQRVAARAARDFARADEIRKTLSERGIVIEDGATGTRWRVEAASAVVP